MIELPMSGFAGRGELKKELTETLLQDASGKSLIINIYGEDGIGKSTLIAAVAEQLNSHSFIVDIDMHKAHLRFPENALYAIRQEIEKESADHFSLFDIIYLMRAERIHGKLAISPTKYFRCNSEALNKVFTTYDCEEYFSRNVYKAVEEGVLDEWFEKYARKSVMRMFQEQNQLNWESLINAFAVGMRLHKEHAKKDMVIVIDNSDDIFEVDDSGNSWAVSLTDKAQCGKFIFLSKKELSPMKTGEQISSVHLENFTPEDAFLYFDSIGITRETVIDTIFDNSKGNPALMSYCMETFDMMTEADGREPTPDIFESDPEGIVHMHLSTLKPDVSTFAKMLSPLRAFNAELFEAVRMEYAKDSDRRKLPIKVFTDLRFAERLGGGFFGIQQLYKSEVVKVLSPELLEGIHYLAYQYHTQKMQYQEDYLNFPLHLYEAVHHAAQALDIEGFITWFRGVEKEYLSAEFFNMWLGIYEQVSEHISAVIGATHPDTAGFTDTLAYLYVKAGRPINAEETMKKSIDAHVELYGKNTPDTVPPMNKLANVYIQTGDFGAAESVLTNGLTIRQESLGENHPDVADSFMRLSNLFMQAGKKGESLEFAEKASAILTLAKGADEEQTFEADENMAAVYAKTRNMPKAVHLYRKISLAKKEKYGEFDKETIKSLGDYAGAVLKNGQTSKAVKLYEDYLEKTEKTYGESSKASASALNDLAFAYQKNKDYEKAEEMHKRALEVKDQIYGDNHPSTATSYSNYAQLKYLTGDLADAEIGYKKAAKVYETVLGRVHKKTALGFNNLGFLTSRMGHFDKAESYYMDALESKKALGEEGTESYASTLNNLGELMYRMGRKDEAKEYLAQALEIYKKILGDDHNTTKVIEKNLEAVSKT